MSKAPEQAYWFAADAGFVAPAEGAPRKFAGTAYTGQPLPHPYWGQVAIDLSSTKANKKVPVLIGHDRDQRAGFCALSIGTGIEVNDGVLLDNEHGRAVAAESDAGFPWQMSVHVEPGSVEDLRGGAKATVNGNEVTGPAVIFRNSTIREVSFTPTGVDNGTSAAAFSTTHTPSNFDQPPKEEPTMEMQELQAKLEAAEADARAQRERADAAETKLAAQAKEAREGEVKALFEALGREYTDAAAKPYVDMEATMFAAVAADMKATKPAAGEHLFSGHAEHGEDHAASQGATRSLNPADIYAKANNRGGAK